MFISHLPLSCLKKYSCEKGKSFIVKRTYVHENENKTMHLKNSYNILAVVIIVVLHAV